MDEGNGYTQHRVLDDDAFGEAKGISVKAFDAFPKTKPSYLTKSHTGLPWTILLIVASISLILSETRRWFAGEISHSFSVEKGISHQLQINLDIVVAMKCSDIHINVQDAAGDRILAGDMLRKDPTTWGQWNQKWATHTLADDIDDHDYGLGDEEDVHDYLGAAKKTKKKFRKTPRLRGPANACHVYGSIESNKVQGDFHITARGHGYMEFGMHLDHNDFNFSHIVNTLSYGPNYPMLINPLSNTRATTDDHFYKFQYYTNIVPTIYTTETNEVSLSPPRHILDPSHANYQPSYSSNTVWTNQYAVTSQSHAVGENYIPGIFFKYDIEPLLLVVREDRGDFLALLVRLVNVVSGVLVAGSWCCALSDYVVETWLYKKGRKSLGFLGNGGQDVKFMDGENKRMAAGPPVQKMVNEHNMAVLQTRFGAQQQALQVTENWVTNIESQVVSLGQVASLGQAPVSQASSSVAVTQPPSGVTQPSAAPVVRSIHPVQPTFGMRAKQQLAGNGPAGPVVDHHGVIGDLDKGSKGRPGNGKRGGGLGSGHVP
ncbi:hypothetical protein FKW77_001834 [Venturia effusa]|uniref:Endoplasmic reticulum-Golgi intermediate compartment protein n=1 Tax=Venturia effusa TaxID=50376 RepID=A0A517LJQ5_9PEZI|nr:hypothetical protein FKW77_001834 [Venturia effusa]